MIKINKEVSITIDGADVQTLTNIFELMRRYLERECPRQKLYNMEKNALALCEFSANEVVSMDKMISGIFDRT